MIIPVPTKFGFASVTKFQLMRSSNMIRSKYTAARQVISYPFAVWMLEANLVEYQGVEASLIRSFLVQLEGAKNTFRLPVPGYYRPSTGYAGNGVTNVAAASRASSLSFSGFPANTLILNEGDYITVNDELKIVTTSIASDAGGLAVLSFKPALRKPVASGTIVYFQAPTILMHGSDDTIATWSIAAPTRQTSKFNAVEAIEL
jgi:hypothetical protein